MGDFGTLKTKFGQNKRVTRLATVTKNCPLVFNELLVYSTLVFRDPKMIGKSARKISELTHLHQSVTVPKILKKLEKLGLVVCLQNKKWLAQFPPENIRDWFCVRSAETFDKRFCYNAIMVPATGSPLTPLQAAIVAQLALKRRNIAIAWFLRVSPKTVARTKKIYTDDFNNDWLQNRGKIKRKKRTKKEKHEHEYGMQIAKELGLGECEDRAYIIKSMDYCCRYLINGGLSRHKAMKFVGDLLIDQKKLEMFWSLPAKFDEIKRIHDNRRKLQETTENDCEKLLRKHYGL